MKDLNRLLKSGRRATVQVPISLALTQPLEDPIVLTDADRVRVYSQSEHVRLYAPDYYDRLASTGFTVEFWNAFDIEPLIANDWNFNPLERLYLARKR